MHSHSSFVQISLPSCLLKMKGKEDEEEEKKGKKKHTHTQWQIHFVCNVIIR